ncbi:Proteasomal ATPase-associated factor 1 [Armadillidium nasatum]|uniref:Proteasomal ATPase-associated factor 1 n=1 Tax=Armadillidium nasatum TaxID=96803 RepID=A0A5N5T7V4_9CRUS|nr:Proteasomal ATPase-associated factor 1 [Armadillidium nasatum]
MQLKIWDAATGHCPVTLKGHTGSVTDFSIVERGKNIISVSKDGTARLWNCAQAKCLNVLVEGESEINCCDIIHVGNEVDIPDAMETTDELEFGTEGKLLAIGCEVGKVIIMSKITEVPQLLCHDSASSILCVKPLKSGFVLGRRDGLCQFYTLDGTSKVQLTGSNCDPIYDVSVDSNFVYTACRDKTIRKYRISDMNI